MDKFIPFEHELRRLRIKAIEQLLTIESVYRKLIFIGKFGVK